jgi:ubiquinone/menaquinone biosynthesis C-methylase UbiE
MYTEKGMHSALDAPSTFDDSRKGEVSDRVAEVRRESAVKLGGEAQRIREVYQGRTQAEIANRSTPLDPFELCAIHEREELLAEVLRENGLITLAGLRILDIGCGTGNLLRHFLDFRADPERCCGIDILDDRIRIAKRCAAGLGYTMASGAQLPFPNETFDLILQFTVFTSVLDVEVRSAMAAEILRTLRPTGIFIWYDFAYNNRRNSNVRGIPRDEMRGLFPGCRFRFRSVTVAPPLGRPAARIYPFLYRALSEIRFLRSHYMCVVEKACGPSG